jgi:hypothetical protein
MLTRGPNEHFLSKLCAIEFSPHADFSGSHCLFQFFPKNNQKCRIGKNPIFMAADF